MNFDLEIHSGVDLYQSFKISANNCREIIKVKDRVKKVESRIKEIESIGINTYNFYNCYVRQAMYFNHE